MHEDVPDGSIRGPTTAVESAEGGGTDTADTDAAQTTAQAGEHSYMQVGGNSPVTAVVLTPSGVVTPYASAVWEHMTDAGRRTFCRRTFEVWDVYGPVDLREAVLDAMSDDEREAYDESDDPYVIVAEAALSAQAITITRVEPEVCEL
jgi:hypothetical protein